MVTFLKIIVQNKQNIVFGRNSITTTKYKIGKYNLPLKLFLVIFTVNIYQIKELFNFKN